MARPINPLIHEEIADIPLYIQKMLVWWSRVQLARTMYLTLSKQNLTGAEVIAKIGDTLSIKSDRGVYMMLNDYCKEVVRQRGAK